MYIYIYICIHNIQRLMLLKALTHDSLAFTHLIDLEGVVWFPTDDCMFRSQGIARIVHCHVYWKVKPW